MLNALPTGGDEAALVTTTTGIAYGTAFPTDRIDGVGLYFPGGLSNLVQVDSVAVVGTNVPVEVSSFTIE